MNSALSNSLLYLAAAIVRVGCPTMLLSPPYLITAHKQPMPKPCITRTSAYETAKTISHPLLIIAIIIRSNNSGVKHHAQKPPRPGPRHLMPPVQAQRRCAPPIAPLFRRPSEFPPVLTHAEARAAPSRLSGATHLLYGCGLRPRVKADPSLKAAKERFLSPACPPDGRHTFQAVAPKADEEA
jgi:hypothetical protein